ncbi:hypothetical protein QO190_02600 [Cloacibacterium sp. Arc13]|uniref:hypothetical protein n=1 Tax=unclassified Cloacibacterium TaxID=2620870 RepID=UPI00352F84A1
MIKRLKYEEVDWQKYQNCLEQSEQYIFFAEKKYLDLLLHQNWEILVDDDYEAVMPIPLAKKWGFTFVVMPLQTQQLGVFSEKDTPELNESFLKFFQKNYKVFYYAFNAKNEFTTLLKTRKNYKLFAEDYENIKKKYSIHRRRNVRITDVLQDKIKFMEAENLNHSESFFTENVIGFTNSSLKKRAFENMKNFLSQNLLKVYELYFDGKLASQAYLIESEKEDFLVNFINDKKFSKHNLSSIILDQIFRKNIEKKDFNFHGSNISEIAEFYRRFGSTEENYAFVENSKIQLLKSYFIRQ